MKKRSPAFILFFLIVSVHLISQERDLWQQPEKVMDVIGIKKGMVIGEAGAGRGYFTFKLAKRVGNSGKIFANDIDPYVLSIINERAKSEKITNITTVPGEVENPLFPSIEMDLIIMVYVFHHLEKPEQFLRNLKHNLKPQAKLVILEQEPKKTGNNHFLDEESITKIVAKVGYNLIKIERFLQKDNIYIFEKNGN